MSYDRLVVVPTYNNPKTIARVAQDVVACGYELVIVDDGSDKKVEELIARNEHISIVRHERNRGKGAAILSGAAKAKEMGYECFVSMDGDGQHLAREVYKLFDSRKDPRQIIIGARNFDIDNVPGKSKVGRAFHNFWIRANTGYDITDSLTGFRLYPVSILELQTRSRRFNFEVEVLVKHYWRYSQMLDTTIECYYPTPEERVSHFDNYRDTAAIIMLHLKLFAMKCLALRSRSAAWS